MLAGLEDIAWAELAHAYGPADDVPARLRALASDHPDTCGEALHELFGNIHHQGTVYPATAPAVGFLLELAADRRVLGRERILDLVAAIADARWQDEEDADALEAHAAVAAGKARLLGLLDDAHPAVGFAAALVLSKLRDHAEELVALLEDAARAAAGVRRAGLVAIVGKLGHGSSEAFLRGEAGSPNPAVRFAAELALVLLLGEEAPAAAVAAVKRLQADEELLEQLLGGLPWDLHAELHPPELFARAGLGGE